MTSFSREVNIGYMIAWDCTIPVFLNIIQCIFLYNCLRPMPGFQSSSISDTSSPTRLSIRNSFRISQMMFNFNSSSRRENEGRSISICNYDEETSTTGDARNSVINLQHTQSSFSSTDKLDKLDKITEKKPVVNPNYNNEEIKHDSLQSINSLKSISKSSKYNNSAKNSISTLSDLNVPPEETGVAIYPSSLTPRNSYCLSPSLITIVQWDTLLKNWNDSRGSELVAVNSSASQDMSNPVIISPEEVALAKASWARSEEDLGTYNKGSFNVSRHTSRSHSSLRLQRDSSTISIYSDITDKQEWLKRRPTSPLVRKITIPRSGLVIKTDY
ncbi:19592_t:CDS:2 [Racocetra persica]|uniref:19592_t:CDS:1 n=1 Tax=Racocetra persica TaxID=160502 RepID=A0ACA9LA01_9GLOM|nr:19592_t:CDS:2 [Racocetra persica]